VVTAAPGRPSANERDGIAEFVLRKSSGRRDKNKAQSDDDFSHAHISIPSKNHYIKKRGESNLVRRRKHSPFQCPTSDHLAI
jgi:hypothetical protein